MSDEKSQADAINHDESTALRPAEAGPNTGGTATASPRSTGGGNAVAGTLSALAIVLALVSVGGGYYLWLEFSELQRTGATQTISKKELRQAQQEVQAALRQDVKQAAADLRTNVAESRGEVQAELKNTVTEVTQALNETRNQLLDDFGEVRGTITALQKDVQRVDMTAQQANAQLKETLTQQFSSALDQSETQFQQALAKTEQQVADALQATSQSVAEVKGTLAELKGALTELRQQTSERLQATEAAQQQLQETVRQAQNQLNQAVTRNRLEWTLNEIAYLINTANRQLAVENDPRKAMKTLNLADSRLAEIDDPAALALRDAIQQDVAALQNVQWPDVEGAALALNHLATEALRLPTAQRVATTEGDSGGKAQPEGTVGEAWSNVKEFTKSALSGLVTVRKDGEIVAPFIPPEQAFFLHQNLRMEVEAARLALLQHSGDVYHNSLATAIDWTRKYFDTDAHVTQQFLTDLQKLDQLQVAPELPALTRSIQTLREVRSQVTASTKAGTHQPT